MNHKQRITLNKSWKMELLTPPPPPPSVTMIVNALRAKVNWSVRIADCTGLAHSPAELELNKNKHEHSLPAIATDMRKFYPIDVNEAQCIVCAPSCYVAYVSCVWKIRKCESYVGTVMASKQNYPAQTRKYGQPCGERKILHVCHSFESPVQETFSAYTIIVVRGK